MIQREGSCPQSHNPLNPPNPAPLFLCLLKQICGYIPGTMLPKHLSLHDICWRERLWKAAPVSARLPKGLQASVSGLCHLGQRGNRPRSLSNKPSPKANPDRRVFLFDLFEGTRRHSPVELFPEITKNDPQISWGNQKGEIPTRLSDRSSVSLIFSSFCSLFFSLSLSVSVSRRIPAFLNVVRKSAPRTQNLTHSGTKHLGTGVFLTFEIRTLDLFRISVFVLRACSTLCVPG